MIWCWPFVYFWYFKIKNNDDLNSKSHDGWRRVPTVLKECDEEYNFDAAVVDDTNCHRLEEGRPWREKSSLSSSSKKDDGNSSSITASKTTDDKVTFERSSRSSKYTKSVELKEKKKYRVIKHVETINESRWPGWRWVNFYHRTLAW